MASIKTTKTNGNSGVGQNTESAIELIATINVLVAIRQPILCDGLAAIINEQPDFRVVATAANCAQCCLKALKLIPDVLVCDLETDEKCDAECLSAFRDELPDMPAIVLHGKKQERRVMGASRLGVQGYLTLDSKSENLFRAIRVAYQGGIFIDQGLRSTFLNLLDENGNGNLSDREFEILSLIAIGKNNRQIAEGIHVSTSTVKHYVSEIYSKLDVSNRAEAVRVAMSKGII